MEIIVWGDYLKHNCFKSWSLLRLHLEYNEGSKEVGMKLRTVHNCSSHCHCLSLREFEEEDMNGVYLKHNCFKSWSLLRLHLGCHEWSKESKNEHLDRGFSLGLRLQEDSCYISSF